MENVVIKIENEYADIWLTYEDKKNVSYCYGGTRSVSFKASDNEAEEVLNYLGCYESGVKNTLINQAIREGVFEGFEGVLPKGFSESYVGGGRCVFRPKSEHIESIIKRS